MEGAFFYGGEEEEKKKLGYRGKSFPFVIFFKVLLFLFKLLIFTHLKIITKILIYIFNST